MNERDATVRRWSSFILRTLVLLNVGCVCTVAYKEVVIIICFSSAVYESLGLTSSVEPAGCGMVLVLLGREWTVAEGVILWMEGRLLPYRFRPAGSCRRFPLLVWYPALVVFLFPTLLIGDRHQIFNRIKPLAKFLWSIRVHLSDEHIQKSSPLCAPWRRMREWRYGSTIS
jgi:hypothetical protein